MTAPSLLGDRVEVLPLVIADLESRIAGGAKQYGEPLTTHNGRDTLWDAYEEALDLCLYLRQTLEERRSRHAEIADMAKRIEAAERDARATKRSAETLCRIYFEIAAEAVGEDKVRAERDRRIHATQEGEG